MFSLRKLAVRFIAFLVLFAASQGRADFALRDGDTVAFLGDSITAARGYTKIVELYTLMRFPERRVRFINAGKGGDTASGSLERLERDVFGKGATVATMAFGVNDIGWGMKADAEHKQRYLDAIRSLIEICRARNVRPIICSAAITSESPDKAEVSFLQQMTDEGLALAKSLGVETIDIQRGMREIQRRVVAANAAEKDPKKQVRLHVEDGIHLNDLGHLAMAYAMVKGLGAPEDVSSAILDARQDKALSTNGCAISDIKLRDDGLEFVRLDRGLPVNLGAFSALNYRWVTVPDGINRYLLTVTNLPPAEYEIRVESRLLGKFNAAQLARGINISSTTSNAWEPGGPWDVQSVAVKELVDARDKLSVAAGERFQFLPNHPANADLEKAAIRSEDDLINLQRSTAKPYPYHFEIRKAGVSQSKEASGQD